MHAEIGYKGPMSKDNLTSLLDSMLDDSAIDMAASEVRAEEEAVRRRQAEARRAKAEAEAEAVPALDDVVQLTGLTDPDLRQILAKAQPDDILVVLATAEDALQRRILRNLGSESVKWVRDNLAHMHRVTDAERDGARAKVLKVGNALLADGTIGLPEPEAIGRDEAPDPEKKELRELLGDLVRIAEQSGPEALTELAESAGEPLLREGLQRVIRSKGAGGRSGDALRKDLAELRHDLEQRYAQRLKWMVEALVAIGEGESSEAFRERVFSGS